MPNTSEQDAEQLSALADGELDEASVARVCARWRADAPAQASWHAYHLIGDVLRSEDLAGVPGRDRACLARLRERLVNEPVVLAPASTQTLSRDHALAQHLKRRSWGWGKGAAVAAGFAAVAGVLFMLRGPTAESGAPAASLARADGQSAIAALPVGIARTTGPEPSALLADGKLIRDSRLDRYLEAHKGFSGSSALGVPSSFLRGATSDASNR